MILRAGLALTFEFSDLELAPKVLLLLRRKGRGTMLTQRKWIVTTLMALSALPALAQTGWRKFGEPAPAAAPPLDEQAQQADQAGQPMPPPSALTVSAGTWITVR